MTKTKRDPSAYAVASLLLILPSLLRGIAEAYIAFAGLSAEYSDRDMFVYPFGGTEEGVTTLLNILPAMCLVAGAALAAAAVIRGRAGGRLSSLVLSLLTVCCATATWVASLIVMYNDDLIMVIPALVACGFYAACCILTFVGKGWAPGGAFTAVLGVAAACAFVLPTQFGIPLAWACMWYGVAGALRAFFGKRVGDIAEYASAALMLAGPMTVGIMCFVQAWGVPIAYLFAAIVCLLSLAGYFVLRLTRFGKRLDTPEEEVSCGASVSAAPQTVQTMPEPVYERIPEPAPAPALAPVPEVAPASIPEPVSVPEPKPRRQETPPRSVPTFAERSAPAPRREEAPPRRAPIVSVPNFAARPRSSPSASSRPQTMQAAPNFAAERPGAAAPAPSAAPAGTRRCPGGRNIVKTKIISTDTHETDKSRRKNGITSRLALGLGGIGTYMAQEKWNEKHAKTVTEVLFLVIYDDGSRETETTVKGDERYNELIMYLD